jgi:polynucleotide kinase-phosphatase
MNELTIPEFSLVVLIGATGSGKSSFARQHFKPTEIISSDACRGMVSDDENDQAVTEQAFELLHYIAAKRLAMKRLTVIDATNVQQESRKPLLQLAREYDVLPVAIVLNMPEALCLERNAKRPERANVGAYVIRRHSRDLRRSLRYLKKEGFRRIHVLNSEEAMAEATVVREKLWNDKTEETGPFDIIGDVHGCFDELQSLMERLGYEIEADSAALGGLGGYRVTPPPGRKAIFIGDYTDRGPKSMAVLRLVMGMAEAGTAICLPGNHDVKLRQVINGERKSRSQGLDGTMAALEQEPEAFQRKVDRFIKALISHFVLDDGRLVVAHGGMKEEYQGRASGRVRSFALYGATTGERDEFGLPVRLNWGADYRGKAYVVYGHTPVDTPEWLNRTINIDTGCCFGGALTALRYPEMELVSVPALAKYADPGRPFLADELEKERILSAQQTADDVLDIADVSGKRLLTTRLRRQIMIQEGQSAAALEVMSRFAVNPRWLIYLPPTMSPCATSERPEMLEHPDEAFAYYRKEGVETVVCEEKHMGSRAVLIVCRDEDAAVRRFGVQDEGIGVCYTRTGRRFFNDEALEAAFLNRVRDAISAAGLWQELETDWLCLDAELMPWSAKAQALLEQQYAAVGAAGSGALAEVVGLLKMAAQRGLDGSADLLTQYQARAAMIGQFRAAYRHYCWPVSSLDDLRLAPFHLMASEGAVHIDKDHLWHMAMLARLSSADSTILMATPHREVALADAAAVEEAATWWENMTGQGGEGMVVKPRSFVVEGQKGLVQPAVKCRGRDYLRIIYGPEYTELANLARLRRRGLGRKRSLALREFALGLEALERFVRREPLRRVHECVFGVLALESEAVDPRL